MKTLIFGCGAVGLGLGAKLIQSGIKVDFIGHQNTVQCIKENGIRLSENNSDLFIEPRLFNAYYKKLENLKSYDCILVTVKTPDLIDVALELKSSSIHKTKTNIILFQNGWGTSDLVAKEIRSNKIYNAVIYTGYKIINKHHVEVTASTGGIRIGSIFDSPIHSLESFSNKLHSVSVKCEPTNNIKKDLWNKLIFNSSLNPTSAIFNSTYGNIPKSKYAKELVKNIIIESFMILSKIGFSCGWKNSDEYIEYLFSDLLPKVGNHESSMLQDIKNHKKTEIDFLNGQLINLAKKQKIQVPYNFFAFNSIKLLEKNFGISSCKK